MLGILKGWRSKGGKATLYPKKGDFDFLLGFHQEECNAMYTESRRRGAGGRTLCPRSRKGCAICDEGAGGIECCAICAICATDTGGYAADAVLYCMLFLYTLPGEITAELG